LVRNTFKGSGLRCIRKVGARDGNMTEIRHLKLRCTECDGTAFEGTIFSAQEQVDDFLAVVSAARPGF
jgi:hypothetical protein